METSPNNIPEKEKRTKIINIVYIIAALDITWMFLQFSVTPVSICLPAAQEAEKILVRMNATTLPEVLFVLRIYVR